MRQVRSSLRVLGLPVQVLLIAGIRVYRATLGSVLGGQCRFFPSCSHYGEAALRTRGAFEGSALALWRVVRCHPFARGGVDMPPGRPGRHAAYETIIHAGDAA